MKHVMICSLSFFLWFESRLFFGEFPHYVSETGQGFQSKKVLSDSVKSHGEIGGQ